MFGRNLKKIYNFVVRVPKIFNFQSLISKKKRAFTLVEIVVVVALLGIIISGVLSVYLNVITSNKTVEFYSVAYKALDDKLEELRAESFSSLADSNFTVSGLPPGNTGTVSIDNNIDGSPQSDIVQADITIGWNFRKDYQVRAVTYIAKGGIKK